MVSAEMIKIFTEMNRKLFTPGVKTGTATVSVYDYIEDGSLETCDHGSHTELFHHNPKTGSWVTIGVLNEGVYTGMRSVIWTERTAPVDFYGPIQGGRDKQILSEGECFVSVQNVSAVEKGQWIPKEYLTVPKGHVGYVSCAAGFCELVITPVLKRYVFSETHVWQNNPGVMQIRVFESVQDQKRFDAVFADKMAKDGIDHADDLCLGVVCKLKAIKKQDGWWSACIRSGVDGHIEWEHYSTFSTFGAALSAAKSKLLESERNQ